MRKILVLFLVLPMMALGQIKPVVFLSKTVVDDTFFVTNGTDTVMIVAGNPNQILTGVGETLSLPTLIGDSTFIVLTTDTINTGPGVAELYIGDDLRVLDSITGGIWGGTTIAPGVGGSGQTTYTDGQLLIGNSTGNTLSKAALSEGEGIDITNGSGTITILGEDASAANKGIVELATIAETNTGTDATRVVTPDALEDWTGSAQVTTLGTIGTATITNLILQNSVAYKGVVTPLVSGAVNDFNPTGFDTASFANLVVTSDATFSGMVTPRAGAIMTLHNGSASTTVTFLDESALSAAANRYDLPGDEQFTIGAKGSATFYYLNLTSRWRLISYTELPMAALATGIVKNTTTTGVQTIAVAGTDYQLPMDSTWVYIGTDSIYSSTTRIELGDTLDVNGGDIMGFADAHGIIGADHPLVLFLGTGSLNENHFIMASTVSGSGPTITATGPNDANVSLRLATKGWGSIEIHDADIDMRGNNIDDGGVIFLKEQADADADVAGSGQIWVNTATPNELYFTDDAGTDVQLGAAGTHPIALGSDVSGTLPPANMDDRHIVLLFDGSAPTEYIQTASTSMVTVAQFIYPGSTTMGTIQSIAANFWTTDATFAASVRIRDLTNSLTIDSTGTTSTSNINQVGFPSIANVPTGSSVIAIQIQIANATRNCRISSVVFKYL